MARGFPDYANPLYDIASLAFDLSSLETAQIGVSRLDGLGRLVWFDNFRGGIGGWLQLGIFGAPLIKSVNAPYMINPCSIQFGPWPVRAGLVSCSST